MPIKLSRIEVDLIGPLSSFQKDLASITLIYGHNEKGKTFLVEFILKSLFQDLTAFRKDDFRVGKPKGKVFVSGLEREPVVFSPKSSLKLETKWEENGRGMPPNISRLLVVKGGDLNLSKDAGADISHDAVREFLSNQGVFDAIQKNIPLKGTRDARIVGGKINGANSGDIAKRNDVRQELSDISELLERVDLELADGDVVTLNKQMAKIKKRIERLELARRYSAYRLSQELQKLGAELEAFEDGKFELLHNQYSEYMRKHQFLNAKRIEKAAVSQKGEHYPWLKESVDDYQKHFGRAHISEQPIFLILALIALLVAIVFIAIERSWPSIIAIAAALIAGLLHLYRSKQSRSNEFEHNEIEKIRETYQEKFGEPAKDLPTMTVKLEQISADYHAGQHIEKELTKTEEDVRSLGVEIQQGLKAYGQLDPSPAVWEETITTLRDGQKRLQRKIQELGRDLARYDVDPMYYVADDPGLEYDRGAYDSAIAEKEQLEESLGGLEQSLQILKSEIQGTVGEHSLTDWGQLIHRLRELRLAKLASYNEYTTEILAGNLLNQVIEKSRQQEDEKISESLESDIVRKPLHQITKSYVGFEIENDSIKIIDEENQKFDFKDLSTGAREQILLALRIGFAAKVMQGDTAFLILDDAFQYSDWDRRPRLVDALFDLAKEGWQIIYFSMDDHIRDLFDQKGKKAPKNQYIRIDL